jgi:Protein of unknown function (DUF1302)
MARQKSKNPDNSSGLDLRHAIAAAVMLFSPLPASAGELFNNGDAVARWDNVLAYSSAFRTQSRNPALLTNINSDDADRNFTSGIVSNRFDLLSQFDFSASGFGIEASAAAWYDFVYHQKNQNDSPDTFNPYSVPHDQFPRAVRHLQGAYAELVNGFAYGSFNVGDFPVSVRVGRHTLLWGESLFFPENGIAGGQAPVDENKVLGRPGAYARDVYMPVAQAWGSIQLPGGFSFEAYNQFEWRKTRLPSAESWLSTADFLDAGGERYLLGNGQYLLRAGDQKGSSSGQFGAALRWSTGDVDLGLYALRFNAKDPQIYFRPGDVTALNSLYTQYPAIRPGADLNALYPGGTIDSSIVNYARGMTGSYRLVYPEGIQLYGASASVTFANINIAGEISGRTNAPLPSIALFELPGRPGDADRNALYATGATLNAQISTTTSFSRTALWDTAELDAEIAANRRLAVTRNASALDTRDTSSVAIRALFQPTWFEVLPDVNLNLDIALGFGPPSYSRLAFYGAESATDFELGVTAAYRVYWRTSVTYTHFAGSPQHQPLADRDFLMFSIQRNL